MKRIVSLAVILLLLTSIVGSAFAAQTFYTTYTPKSEKSSLFYIDIFCEQEITAAVFDLSYDESMVSFYDVKSAISTASVRENTQSGKVLIAFANSKSDSGQLCRVSFKALQAGSLDFVLHIQQAADGDAKVLSPFDDCTLTVRLGKDDVVSGDTITHSDSKAASSASLTRGDRSSPENGTDGDGSAPRQGGFFDLRRNVSPTRWILLGVGIAVLIAALIGVGFLIGRRTLAKKPVNTESPPLGAADEDPETTDPDNDKE